MKNLVATIALLCLSSTVLAHDIYSNLRDRAGHYCCNGQDCRPVQATVLPDGNYYLPERYENVSRRRLPSDAPGGWSVKHDFWQGHYSGAQATTTLIAVPSCCGRKVARFCSSNTKVPPSLIA